MSIYVLKRKNLVKTDELAEIVVRAGTAQRARKVAAKAHGDEPAEIWLDASQTTCRSVHASGLPIVLVKCVQSQ